jgi:hypothetical protein
MYGIKKNTETLIDFSKEVGVGVNTEKTKYMLFSTPVSTLTYRLYNLIVNK